jgi:hypothetical protein
MTARKSGRFAAMTTFGRIRAVAADAGKAGIGGEGKT